MSLFAQSLELSLTIEDDNDAVLANFTVLMPGNAENILSMERFHGMLKTVKCTNNSMTISFVDDESYRYAQRAWDWVNGADNHSFVMVASKGDCGDNRWRIPYNVHNIVYDDKTVTAQLDAQVAQWSDVAHTYHLRAGHIPADGLTQRDISKSTSLSMNTDFRFKNKIKVDKTSLELRCDPCKTSGSIGFEFNVVTDNLIPQTVEFKAAPKGVQAEMALQVILASEAKISLPPIKFGSFPLPGGLSIPGGILNFGPTLQAQYKADLIGQLAVSFGTGFTATIPDSALLQVDLLNTEKNKFSPWTPSIDINPPKFDVNQARVNFKISHYVELALVLGAEVLNKGIEAGLKFKMPYLEHQAQFFASDLPGVCKKDPKGDVGIKLTNSYGVELKFEAGKVNTSGGKKPVEVSLAAGNFPLGELCFAWDAPGSPKPSSTKEPTPTKTADPDGNSCKVGNSYGSGKCLKTKTCMNQNKVPVPGYCPDDPDDVQCCVEYKGANSCTVDTTKKTGSCLSVTVCESSDGVSTAGYCPNDPKGIQVCHQEEMIMKLS